MERNYLNDILINYTEEYIDKISIDINSGVYLKNTRFKAFDIYSGTSGCGLFLINLSEHLKEAKYLALAEDVAHWMINHNDISKEVSNSSFYSGYTGISFFYLKLYKATNKMLYKKEAISLLKNNNILKVNNFDLMSGLTGTILGILHCYNLLHELFLLKRINSAIEKLVKEVKVSNYGCYWDEANMNILPLCGLAHGVSGVAFVLTELANYFNNPSFLFLAFEGRQYENSYYDKSLANWPDFRSQFRGNPNTDISRYALGDKAHFEQRPPMTAWCHGAPGIGISRLNMYNMVANINLKNELYNIASKIENSLKENLMHMNICHGTLGNGLILMQIVSQLKLENYKECALKPLSLLKGAVANGSLEEKSVGLFTGVIGAGHYLLQCASYDKFLSLINPQVKRVGNAANSRYKEFSFLNLNFSELHKILIRKYFPKSYKEILVNSKLKFTSSLCLNPNNRFHEMFITFLSDSTPEILQSVDYQCDFALVEVELKNCFLSRVRNLAIQNIIDKKKKNQDTEWDSESFILNKHFRIIEINDKYYLIYIDSYGEKRSQAISLEEYCLLTFFLSKNSFKNFTNALYESKSPNDKTVILKSIHYFKNYLLAFVFCGVLVPSVVAEYDQKIEFTPYT
ncbi:hypothetical protein GCM10009122_12330 [Fulvivirga kasyanovii]